jgi:regulator of protease activity HflC (stomatin/prohibitin superfamily)
VIKERERSASNGLLVLLLMLVIMAVSVYGLVTAIRGAEAGGGKFLIGVWVFIMVVDGICFGGLFMVNPNQGVVLQLFGDYKGTVREPGLRWANPFYSKKPISLRVRNFETGRLKVNDKDGNPIEIASVVVWKVVDTAEACFEVDDYENYVHVQSESALRNLATAYPYDSHEDEQTSLRGHTSAVAAHLQTEIPDQSPGLCSGNCRRHVATAAGGRHHRRPAANCGRRRGDGGDGLGPVGQQ